MLVSSFFPYVLSAIAYCGVYATFPRDVAMVATESAVVHSSSEDRVTGDEDDSRNFL